MKINLRKSEESIGKYYSDIQLITYSGEHTRSSNQIVPKRYISIKSCITLCANWTLIFEKLAAKNY